MNKRAKGKILTIKAKNILISKDYLVEIARPKLMFIGPGRMITKEEDFFGAWDIWAIKDQETRLIQCSMWTLRLAKIGQVKNFPADYGKQELWLWWPGRGCHFRICRREDNFEWKGLCEMEVEK